MASLSLSNFVRSSTILTPLATATPNVNNLALFTTDTPLNSENYGIYIDSISVEQNYGSASSTTKMAQAIFSQTPNIISAGGKLIIFPLIGDEELETAIARVKNAAYVFFYGIITNKTLSNNQLTAIANYIQAQPQEKANMFFHHTATLTDNDNDGIIKAITDLKDVRTSILLHPDDNIVANVVKSAITGRFFTTNFNVSNSATNIHAKTLTSIASNTKLTQADLIQSQTTGAMLYPTFDGVGGKIFESGANDFRDNIYYQDMINFEVQYALANVLFTTQNKIPQTNDGVDVFIDALIAVFEQAKKANIVASGLTWNNPYTFGNPVSFKKNITEQGYYIYYVPVEQQSQTDREARKAPFIQWACKFSGAINFLDVFGVIGR